MQKIIGILPPANLFEDEMPHHDLYPFANPYAKQIARHALPIGMLPVDGLLTEDVLSLCDAFLLTGGKKIWPYHLQAIDHAIRLRKPVLGICLGMQAIAAYFQVLARKEAIGGSLLACFADMKRAGFLFNLPVANHYLQNVMHDSTACSRHPITVRAGSRLHEAIGRAHAQAVSLHSYQIAPPASVLSVTATAPDGTIEGIEYEGFLVGVQFHPEVDDGWEGLFAALTGGGWA